VSSLGTVLVPSIWVVLVAAGLRVAVPLATTICHLMLERARRATLLTAARAVPEGGVLVESRSDGSTITVCAGQAAAESRRRSKTGERR
jgi:hypothetical protein